MAGSFRYLCAGLDGSKVSEKMLINMNSYERDLGQKERSVKIQVHWGFAVKAQRSLDTKLKNPDTLRKYSKIELVAGLNSFLLTPAINHLNHPRWKLQL